VKDATIMPDPDSADTHTLYVPRGETHISRRVKNSRFLGVLSPIISREHAMARRDELRTAHPEAAHVVYAFALGAPKERVFGQSDDGEPAGTAGKPVLAVLDGRRITNAIVAVVRYFGGTKLGTGGLVHAYGNTAAELVTAASLQPLRLVRRARVALSYAVFEPVRDVVVELGGTVDDTEYGTTVESQFTIAADRAESLQARIRDLSKGAADVRFSDPFWG
jgi:uncharacterized YigZ family protein